MIACEKPDLITMEFVNDASLRGEDFKKYYNEILKRVHVLNAELIIITPNFTCRQWMKDMPATYKNTPDKRAMSINRILKIDGKLTIDLSLKL